MKRMRPFRDTLSIAFLFAPGFVIYLGLMILPIILCCYNSFFDWDGIRPTMNFIGMDNFFEAFKDGEFFNCLRVTFFLAILGTVIVNSLGILLAMLVNGRGIMTNIYRSVFFFPLLVGPLVIGFIWKALLTYSGIVNSMLVKVGIEAINFIGDPVLAPWATLLVNIWHDTGYVTVLYLTGLQAIPTDLYDSAMIDGASSWQRFARITFPWLAPSFTFCIISCFTFYMRLYDIVASMTSAGPAGATETIAYYVIRVGFSQNRLSYGSSLAIYMLLIIGVISVILVTFLRRREEHLIT